MQDTTTSSPPPGEPEGRRRPRLLRVVIGLAIPIAMLAVFAWQWGGDGGSDGPLNAIAEAAERTQRELGGRAALYEAISSPGQSEPVAIRGQMVFNAAGRTRGVLRVLRHRSKSPVKMEAIADGTVIYMSSNKFGALPGGAKWMSLDLSLGQELNASLPANIDAEGELGLLEAVTDHVQKLGKEDVRGVRTTRYRGTASVSKQVERLREEGADDLASLVEEDGSPFRIEAWIDAGGLVRRMRIVQSEPAGEDKDPGIIDMRVDFYDFGINPEIDVPDPSEVFDETGQVRNKLGVSNGD